MEEKPILEKRYSIPYEMFGNGFTAFQKKFVYPRIYVVSVILLAAAVFNIVNIALGNSSTIGYVLVMLCLAIVAVNWYNPKKLKRNLMESIKGIENDVYSLKVYPDVMKIGTVMETGPEKESTEEFEKAFEGLGGENEQIAETPIYLSKGITILDKEEFFLVYIKSAMFYIIPKKDLSEEEIMILKLHFRKSLDRNFVSDFKL